MANGQLEFIEKSGASWSALKCDRFKISSKETKKRKYWIQNSDGLFVFQSHVWINWNKIYNAVAFKD